MAQPLCATRTATAMPRNIIIPLQHTGEYKIPSYECLRFAGEYPFSLSYLRDVNRYLVNHGGGERYDTENGRPFPYRYGSSD